MRDYFYCCVKWLIIVCLLLKCLSSLTSQTLLPPNTLVLQLEQMSIAQIERTLSSEEKVDQVALNNPTSKRPTIRPSVIPKLKSRYVNRNKSKKILTKEILHLISPLFNKNSRLR